MSRTLAATALALSAAAFAVGPAQARQIVDDDRAQCPLARHATIQAGVDAAVPGEQVLVCNGVYREAVVIDGPEKNGIQLVANSTGRGTIRLPDDVVGSMVTIRNAQNVQLRRFRIVTDNVNGFAGSAVIIQDSAGVRVERNQIIDNEAQNGDMSEGIQTFASGKLVIIGNRIEEYESTGIAIEVGSENNVITQNTLVASPTLFEPEIVQTGIWLGGEADITNNQISGNRSNRTVDSLRGAGIRDNSAFFGTTGNRIAGNRITGNEIGLSLATTGGFVTSNVVTGNLLQGVLLTEESSGTKVERNDARGNGGLDCEDRTAGSNPTRRGFPNYTTLNLWVNTKGLDASPAQICTPSGAAGPPVP